MYFAGICSSGSGFTNQIFSFITAILHAIIRKDKVVIVDSFLNDYSKHDSTPISKIFDIEKINIFLKKYNIIVIDRHDIKFEILSFLYGTKEKNVNITDDLKQYYKNNILFIDKNINFNNIKGDPCFSIKKNLFFNYKINDYYVEEVYEEVLSSDIIINFNSACGNNFKWINSINKEIFDDILINIQYNKIFNEKANIILEKLNNNKINILHLRLEDDAMNHWSRMNNMTKNDFKKYIEDKYIHLIEKYIDKNDNNIILSHSLTNPVIDYLKENNYSYLFSDKFFEGRELNAIVDLLISKNCNNIIISNFNFNKLNGSTFSYYIGKINNVKNISIDLDKITNNETILCKF
jgi:hypothetical protein